MDPPIGESPTNEPLDFVKQWSLGYAIATVYLARKIVEDRLFSDGSKYTKEKIEKYLQRYLDDVISPEVNNELVGEDDEPIKLSVYKVTHGESNPNRLNFFLEMDPDWSKGSITNKINLDITSFFRMLGLDKTLHIYWNKRPLF